MPVHKDESGRRSVQAEVEVTGSPETVWQAIASGPGISSWFVPTTLEQRQGGSTVSDFGPGMESHATITAWDPPHRFVAESAEDMGPGTRLPVGDEGAFFVRISAPEARDRLYVPAARVRHEVEAENVSLKAALQRSYAQGMAQARVRIPLGPPGVRPARPPIHRFLQERIRSAGGVRGFICKVVRHAGYFIESRRS